MLVSQHYGSEIPNCWITCLNYKKKRIVKSQTEYEKEKIFDLRIHIVIRLILQWVYFNRSKAHIWPKSGASGNISMLHISFC